MAIKFSWIDVLLASELLVGVLFIAPLRAHEHNGVKYTQWVNGVDKGCCNNHDCRPIADQDVRMSPVTEVFIEGKWCPVKPHHYLKQGNAPDWSSAHVCVHRTYVSGTEITPGLSACDRLICFQPKPLF